MKARTVKLVFIAAAMSIAMRYAIAIDKNFAGAFAGRDVYIEGNKAINFHGGNDEDVLMVEERFSLVAGSDTFTGDRAVVWISRKQSPNGIKKTSVWAYIWGRISGSGGKGIRVPNLKWQPIDAQRAEIVWFEVSGEVFVTARSIEQADVRGEEFYAKAFETVGDIDNSFIEQFETVSPIKKIVEEPNLAKPSSSPQSTNQLTDKEAKQSVRQPAGEKSSGGPLGSFGFLERILGSSKTETSSEKIGADVHERYPVNFAPAGDQEPNIESGKLENGTEIATIIGRFYLWQRQDEKGRLLEIQADSAVIFYSRSKAGKQAETDETQDNSIKGNIDAIYVCGDVVLTEGFRTIRTDEMYYDFVDKKGIAVNATMRTFDPGRGIPIYVRAVKLRQISDGKFAANDVMITSSEFHTPQISLNASSIVVTDATAIAQEADKISDSDYDLKMHDVRLKTGDTTFFYWPQMRSNLERPDVPFKSMRVGNDGIWGTTVESRWYLSRLLGLEEPEGTDGTFELDYFSDRGLGSGVDVDYAQEDRLGHITGYIIDDRGKDRLGRDSSRKNLEPPHELRGRFGWVNRTFMPYNWQLTTGINYESDENFVESYYRREFNTGPDRETYVHLKRIEDNWGLAFLGKGRINNFADELEQYPTGEYHLTAQSIFDDKMTLYSDTVAGQYRQRIGTHHTTAIDEGPFASGAHRTELDMPIWVSGIKAVPYIAGTAGYDDRSGFNRSIVDGSDSGNFNEKAVGIAEVGFRASSEFWKVYPGIESRLWDIDGLRHIIRPEVVTAVYGESDNIVKQHDVIHAGLSQRLQTRRGPANESKTVDWMRLDLGGTWFTNNDPRTEDSGPYRFIWNRPMAPLRMYTMPGILNGDLNKDALRKFETYGPQRDYLNADYAWQISDTTAFLSDAFYDIHEGTFEQVDVGFSRMRSPDLSYYIGSRYLRNVKVLEEHGSNAFIFAATYVLDPRYSLVFSQQYDFDYGANVESDITIIRRYSRVFWSLTFSADASLDRTGIMFSIWPEGVPELAVGSRRYTGLAGPGGY